MKKIISDYMKDKQKNEKENAKNVSKARRIF